MAIRGWLGECVVGWVLVCVFHDLPCEHDSDYSFALSLSNKKRLLLKCIHYSKSDLINNMDHMRISGNEPSSVILSQTK